MMPGEDGSAWPRPPQQVRDLIIMLTAMGEETDASSA
jgi:hypothetical protein